MIAQVTAAWSYLEWMLTCAGLFLSFVAAAYFFLKDPLWRAEKFGFLPTVITVIFDKKARKVFICHLKNGVDMWIMPQGMIEESVLESARQILFQELGMQRFLKIRSTQYLGTMRFRPEEKHRLERFTDAQKFKFTRKWKGKVYIALFVQTTIAKAFEELEWSFLYDAAEFVDLETAEARLSLNQEPMKVEMFKMILGSLKEEFKGGKSE